MKNKNSPPNQNLTSHPPLRQSSTDPSVVEEEVYYSRQTALKEIAGTGQERLKNAKLAMIGSGALGCAALPYLAAAGIGTIAIFDDDRIEASNLNRQTLFCYKDIGQYKAEVASRYLKDHNPFIRVHGKALRITRENVAKYLSEYEVLIDGSDNLATKYLLSDFSFSHRKPLVSAGIYQFSGQIHVFSDFSNGCYRCFWPEKPEQTRRGQNCSQAGILGSVAGVLGSIQAHEAIKIILGLPRLSDDTLFSINLMDDTYRKIKKFRRDDCPTCTKISESALDAATLTTASPSRLPQSKKIRSAKDLDLDFADLKSVQNAVFIDIRDEENLPLPSQTSVPFLTIPHWDMESFSQLPQDKTYILVCQSGQTSKLLARELFIKFPQKHFFAMKASIDDVKTLLHHL